MKRLLIAFVFILTTFSCSRYVGTKASDKNLKIPVGTFYNASIDTSAGRTFFWEEINQKSSVPAYLLKSAFIRIEKVNKKYVDLILLVEGKEIKRIKRELKYRAGKFFLKKESYFEVEHVVFLRIGGKHFYLNLNENNNLVLKTESSVTAFFIILPVGGTSYGKEKEYKKVD